MPLMVMWGEPEDPLPLALQVHALQARFRERQQRGEVKMDGNKVTDKESRSMMQHIQVRVLHGSLAIPCCVCMGDNTPCWKED